MACLGSCLSDEVALIAGPDAFAPELIVAHKFSPEMARSLCSCALRFAVTERLGDALESTGLGIEGVNRLVALEAEPVIQLAQE